MDFVSSCLVVGFVGDASLQLLTRNWDRAKEWGFVRYFQKHGPLSSTFIASGMMGLAGLFHIVVLGEPTVISCALLGGGLDVIFRLTYPIIMPELNDYYTNLNPLFTISWGIIPLELALLVFLSLS